MKIVLTVWGSATGNILPIVSKIHILSKFLSEFTKDGSPDFTGKGIYVKHEFNAGAR